MDETMRRGVGCGRESETCSAPESVRRPVKDVVAATVKSVRGKLYGSVSTLTTFLQLMVIPQCEQHGSLVGPRVRGGPPAYPRRRSNIF